MCVDLNEYVPSNPEGGQGMDRIVYDLYRCNFEVLERRISQNSGELVVGYQLGIRMTLAAFLEAGTLPQGSR